MIATLRKKINAYDVHACKVMHVSYALYYSFHDHMLLTSKEKNVYQSIQNVLELWVFLHILEWKMGKFKSI